MAGAGPIPVALEKVDLLTNMTLPPFEGEITNVVRAPAGYIVHSIWACGLFFGLGIFRCWAASRQRPLRRAAAQVKNGVAGVAAE